jgi:hypothetical protein
VKRTLLAAVAAILLTVAPALADAPVVLTFDGRPLDRHPGAALLHNGVVYADVVDLTRALDGVLSFPTRRSVEILVDGNVGTFTVGRPVMALNRGSAKIDGAPFVHDGDIYVPLRAFVVRLAQRRVTANAAHTRADIQVQI